MRLDENFMSWKLELGGGEDETNGPSPTIVYLRGAVKPFSQVQGCPKIVG